MAGSFDSDNNDREREARPAEELVRADAYGLLASLLNDAPDDALLERLKTLLGDESDLGRAIDAIGEAARNASGSMVRDEFERLFIGIGRGELVPHASFYLTGFLNEKPLAKLRDDLAALGVERAPGNVVPEDHIACVCDVMAGIIRGDYAEAGSICQRTFFERHIATWAERFFGDLAKASSATFYAPVGRFGRELVRIDGVAFQMAA